MGGNHWQTKELFAESLPCQQEGGCSYSSTHDLDPGEFDVLVGHYRHAHVPERVENRYIVFDKFPEGDFLAQYSVGVVSKPLNTYLNNNDGLDFEYLRDLKELRRNHQNKQIGIKWFEKHNPTLKRDVDGAVTAPSGNGHEAPAMTYAILTAKDLDNKWEYTRLPDGQTAVVNPANESLTVLNQPALNDFIDGINRTHTDPKIATLRDDIRTFRQEARDNIVIFTQYQDTLEYIRRVLTDTHPNVGTYSGAGASRYDSESGSWNTVGKETIKQEFTSTGGTNILICTDSASEGLNLQTADALINYDLPWNPMRVEQRIGRIDRIGQENSIVKIINYAYEDSIDGDIYEELESRLDMFEDVVGPMRPVLNNLEKDIKAAAMGTGSESKSELGGASRSLNRQKRKPKQRR